MWLHDGLQNQVARLGLPLVNILFNAPADKDSFNRSEPAQQKAMFMDKVVAQLMAFGHSTSGAQEIAQQGDHPEILPLHLLAALFHALAVIGIVFLVLAQPDGDGQP